ncbi:MAG: hypothetical protein M1815_004069, partial [Lichina confinis]
ENNSPAPNKEVLEVVNRIERKIDALETQTWNQTQNQQMYAVAAKRGASALTALGVTAGPTQTHTRNNPAPRRELRSIVVHVQNLVEAVGLKRVTRTELLSRIRATGDNHTADIVEIRRLTSGDLLVGTSTEGARKQLEDNQHWLEAVASSARIKKKIYTMMAHGIRVAGVDTACQDEAIKLLERQNRALHSGLKIERLTWPWSADGKQFSTLLIDTYCLMVANRLIDEGLLEDLQVHTWPAKARRNAHIAQGTIERRNADGQTTDPRPAARTATKQAMQPG